MDTTKIIEAVTKLSEMDLQEVVEAIQGYAEKNNMDHIISGHSGDEYEEVVSNLSETTTKLEDTTEKLEALLYLTRKRQKLLFEIAEIDNKISAAIEEPKAE